MIHGFRIEHLFFFFFFFFLYIAYTTEDYTLLQRLHFQNMYECHLLFNFKTRYRNTDSSYASEWLKRCLSILKITISLTRFYFPYLFIHLFWYSFEDSINGTWRFSLMNTAWWQKVFEFSFIRDLKKTTFTFNKPLCECAGQKVLGLCDFTSKSSVQLYLSFKFF